MKKLIIIIIVLLVIPIALFAQITKKQANEIVTKYIEKEITEYHLLYAKDNLASDEQTTVSTWNNQTLYVDYSCFVYFVDEHPLANWEHPCRYFIKLERIDEGK